MIQNAHHHRHSEQLRKCLHTSGPLVACYLIILKILRCMANPLLSWPQNVYPTASVQEACRSDSR